MKGLLLSGGIHHPFAETSVVVAGLLRGIGVGCDTHGVRDGLDRLAAERFDLLVVNALAFSMTQHEKYAPLRAEHAFAATEADRAALCGHVARGGGLLGLHTAAICFDGWDGWCDLLGAAWVWGASYHPPVVDLEVSGPDGTGTVRDELYCDLALARGATVVATATDGVEAQPVLVTHGRASYLALGHDRASVEAPAYAPLLRRAAAHALGREAAAA